MVILKIRFVNFQVFFTIFDVCLVAGNLITRLRKEAPDFCKYAKSADLMSDAITNITS